MLRVMKIFPAVWYIYVYIRPYVYKYMYVYIDVCIEQGIKWIDIKRVVKMME